MKIDKEVNMSSSGTSKRDKSMDVKERAKQDKLQKEKEKRLEKERKEREKKEKERLEKERKEREKSLKKSTNNLSSQPISTPIITSSATASEINRLAKQGSQYSNDPDYAPNAAGAPSNMPNSKSENVLSIFKKQTSNDGSGKNSNKNKSQDALQSQKTLSKGRFYCQIVYLDESVKQFDLDKNAIGDDLMSLVFILKI